MRPPRYEFSNITKCILITHIEFIHSVIFFKFVDPQAFEIANWLNYERKHVRDMLILGFEGLTGPNGYSVYLVEIDTAPLVILTK